MSPDLVARLTLVDSLAGPVWTLKDDPYHVGIIDEVITRDTYRLKSLVESGFNPRTIVDLGANIGTFTLLAAHYWPEALIYSFEPNAGHFTFLTLNCAAKAVLMRTAVIGYPQRIQQSQADEERWRNTPGAAISVAVMRNIVGYPDLVKMDVEESEINIIPDMAENGMFEGIKWVIGEWHFQPARRTVQEVLSRTHNLTIHEGNQFYDWAGFWAQRK